MDDNLLELDMPLVVVAGVGYQAMKNLLLAADVEYRNSGSGVVNRRDSLRLVPGGKDTEFFTEIDPYWNNVWALRFGGEYLWETGSIYAPTVALRAGFGWAQIPEPNSVVSINAADPLGDPIIETSTASKTQWALGGGVRWAQIHLDLAFTKVNFDMQNELVDLQQESTIDNKTFSMTFTGYF
jgi:hypothetical protein